MITRQREAAVSLLAKMSEALADVNGCDEIVPSYPTLHPTSSLDFRREPIRPRTNHLKSISKEKNVIAEVRLFCDIGYAKVTSYHGVRPRRIAG